MPSTYSLVEDKFDLQWCLGSSYVAASEGWRQGKQDASTELARSNTTTPARGSALLRRENEGIDKRQRDRKGGQEGGQEPREPSFAGHAAQALQEWGSRTLACVLIRQLRDGRLPGRPGGYLTLHKCKPEAGQVQSPSHGVGTWAWTHARKQPDAWLGRPS